MTRRSTRVSVPTELKSELAALSHEELQAVGKLVATMTGGKFVASDKVTKVDTGGQFSRSESLYSAITDYLYTETRHRAKNFQLLLAQQDKQAKALIEKQRAFDQFLDEATGSHELTEAERYKFYTITANLIGASLKELKVVFTVNTMINWLDKAPVLFDCEFPSYIKSGLLHMVVFASLQKRVAGKSGIVKEGRSDDSKKRERRSRDYKKRREAAAAARRQQYKVSL
ncbi:hypothetical protein [Pseudoalteromonas umbrosa]|uniref:hypothetical protein n=1 Tax=Pseudoalteromonas umbrosa TaxID=3048489 RepID=UPI0024C4074B|nr:hypothetical protein [Pseudoalteromonas sp. B95]MDK1290144.1 hypothetical protein [Pseudoalteromonas sp. B95]